jgi:hypothetical protein
MVTAALTMPLLVLGCDPGITVQGKVITKAGVPMVGASITVVCPPGDHYVSGALSATSDANGAFSMSGMGCLPKACKTRVQLNGNTAERSVGDDCRRTVFVCSNRYCNEVESSLTLK